MFTLTHSHRTPAVVRGPFLADVAILRGPDFVVFCIYMTSMLSTPLLRALLCLGLDRQVTVDTEGGQKVSYRFVNKVFQVQYFMKSLVYIESANRCLVTSRISSQSFPSGRHLPAMVSSVE